MVATFEQPAVAEEVERKQDFCLAALDTVLRGCAAQSRRHGRDCTCDVPIFQFGNIWMAGDPQSPQRNDVQETAMRSHRVPDGEGHARHEAVDVEVEAEAAGVREEILEPAREVRYMD